MKFYTTKTSWIVILAFIVIGFGVSTCAHAETYGLVGIGQGKALLSQGTADGGIAWQQKGFPHHEGRTDTVYTLGLGYAFDHTFAVEARYQTGMAVTVHGQYGFEDDGRPTDLVTGDGGAHVKGVSLAVIGRYPLTPSLSLGVEGGAFFWDSAFRVRMTTCDGSVTHDPIKSRGLGSLLGVVVGYGKFDLRYELYHVEPRDGNFNAIKEISLNYRF